MTDILHVNLFMLNSYIWASFMLTPVFCILKSFEARTITIFATFN